MAPPSTIKDHGGLSRWPQQLTYLAEQDGEHAGQGGVSLGRDHEQRIAPLIIHPIIGGGGSGESRSGHIGFSNGVFTVIGANMAIDVEEAEHVSVFSNALASDLPAQFMAGFSGR